MKIELSQVENGHDESFFIGMMIIPVFIMGIRKPLGHISGMGVQTWPYIRYKTATRSLSSAITAILSLIIGLGKFPMHYIGNRRGKLDLMSGKGSHRRSFYWL